MFVQNNQGLSRQSAAIKSLLDTYSNTAKANGITQAEMQTAQFSFESLDTKSGTNYGNMAHQLENKANAMLDAIDGVFRHRDNANVSLVSECFGDMSISRKNIARELAALSGFTKEEMIARRTARHNKSMVDGINVNDYQFVSESATQGYTDAFFNPIGNPQYASEAYQEPKNDQWQSVTAVYNLLGVDACPFANAFFETIVVPIEQAGIITNINIPSLRYRNRNYTPNGARVEFQRKLFTDLYFTPSKVLDFSDTKLIPAYRDNADATQDTKAMFVPGYTKVIQQEGQPVTTGYISFARPAAENNGFNYLALCQTADSLSRGMFNDTDTVGKTINLKTLVFQITGTVNIAGTPTSVTELIPVDVTGYATSKFTYRQFNGNTQEMELKFSTREIFLRKDMTTVNGATSQLLAQLGDKRVALAMSAGMIMKLDEGNLYNIDHNPTNLRIRDVIDGSGTKLATTDAGYTAVANLLVTPAVNYSGATLKCLGFEIDAYRANANNRTQGMILDDQTWRGVLTTKIQPSIGAIFPLDNATMNINASAQIPDMLTKLLVATKAQTESVAIQYLFDTAVRIDELQKRGERTIYDHGGFTVGAQLVDPVIDDRGAVALSSLIKTLDSSATIDNLDAAVINYLRAAIVDLEVKSRFAVINKLYNGENAKIKVTIGTHYTIAHWLNRVGDIRKLGLDDSKYDVEIVETFNTQMTDTVIMTIHGGNANGSFNPTAFGHMLWAPEIVANYQKTDSNTVSQEMRVQPCFDFYANLPIMFKVTFPNWTSYFKQAQLYQVGTTAQ